VESGLRPGSHYLDVSRERGRDGVTHSVLVGMCSSECECQASGILKRAYGESIRAGMSIFRDSCSVGYQRIDQCLQVPRINTGGIIVSVSVY